MIEHVSNVAVCPFGSKKMPFARPLDDDVVWVAAIRLDLRLLIAQSYGHLGLPALTLGCLLHRMGPFRNATEMVDRRVWVRVAATVYAVDQEHRAPFHIEPAILLGTCVWQQSCPSTPKPVVSFC